MSSVPQVEQRRPGELPPTVELAGLVERFGPVTALDGVDLTVVPGEVLGYVGPNGSGKTTTMRVLLGLIRPGAGRATVGGADCWREAPAVHALVGHVGAEPVLDPRLTGWQHVQRVARLRRLDLDPRAADLADRLDLDLTRRTAGASRGTRQKLAVVLALAHRPRVLLLDEPTSGLDPVAQQEFHRLVREHTADGGCALLASHVLSEVEHTADRVAVLRAGRVVAEGTPGQLRARSPHRVRARLGIPIGEDWLRALAGVTDVTATGDRFSCAVPTSSLPDLCAELAQHRVLELDCRQADLEESVLGWYRQGPS